VLYQLNTTNEIMKSDPFSISALSTECAVFITVLLAASACLAGSAPMLAPTPPMGWNSWNWFGKQAINEHIVREVVDAMADNGLRDAGYTYIVVDGGWRDTKLGPNGELLASPGKFPHGIKPLADYVHAKGFKFGLHTVPGTRDCGGDPVGGFGHEEIQVREFVDWGLDFIKLDKCRYDPGWTEDLLKSVYLRWSDLLAQGGRPIVLSISAYKWRDWYPQVGQMGRTTGDIRHHGGARFDGPNGSVMKIADINNQSAAFAGPGYWNDPDMLVTGDQGLTQDEQKTHFALWCVMSAPLMLGDDPRQITPAEKEIVLNSGCIAIDQDPTEQGKRIKSDGQGEVWVKKLAGHRLAVLLLNRDAAETNRIGVSWKDLGLAEKMDVKDVYAKTDLGVQEGALTRSIAPHACCLLLLSPPLDRASVR
jgi:alpha-galactosidase